MIGSSDNRIDEVVVAGLLTILQDTVSHQQTIAILEAPPTNSCSVLAYAIHLEGGYRTTSRNQFNRYIRDISIVGYTKLTKEHDILTHIAQEVSLIILEAHAEGLVTGVAQINRIYRHKGIQITRVTYDTDNDLTVIGRRTATTAPEVDLVLTDRIHEQLRHDGIRSDIVGSGTIYIVVQIEVVVSIVHIAGSRTYVGHIAGRGRQARCLATDRPTRQIAIGARSDDVSFFGREGDCTIRTDSIGLHSQTRRDKVQRTPLRNNRITDRSGVDVESRLLRQAVYTLRTRIECIAEDDIRGRYTIGRREQRIGIELLIADKQNPIVVRTQTTADTYTLRREVRIGRLGERTSHLEDRYIIQVDGASRIIRRTPSEILSCSRYQRLVFTEVIRILFAATRSLDRIEHYKRT